MSDPEFQDLLIACKGMVIAGNDESVIRDMLRSRGVASDDAARLIAALDFTEQDRSRRADIPYRIAGAIALVVGGVGGMVLYFSADASLLYRAFFGLAAFGLYFTLLGSDGIIWRD